MFEGDDDFVDVVQKRDPSTDVGEKAEEKQIKGTLSSK